MRRLLPVLAALCLAAASLAAPPLHAAEQTMAPPIQEVKARHAEALMALAGVVSVGVGRDDEGRPAIVVGLDGPRPETAARLPDELEGHPVVVKVTGPVKAQ